MAGGSLSFIHVSDLHILADEDKLQYGAKTTSILQQGIPLLNALRPDFIIASGDLVSDESEDSYRRLQSLLAPLTSPIHLMLGNHDDRAAFRRVFRPRENPSRQPICEAFEQSGVRFLLLDSSLPGKEEGLLDPGQLRWLETELAGHPGQLACVFLHHQPLPIHIRWLDQLGLQNQEQFLSVLACHRQVQVVGYGHVHQARRWRYNHALFAGVPAMAFQFSALSQEPKVTLETPAFRRYEVSGEAYRSWLHYLDGRVVPEPGLLATPIYVR
jgi:3',5'-cyclic-AMP phosphodiesterase